jgi:hypothetical protein
MSITKDDNEIGLGENIVFNCTDDEEDYWLMGRRDDDFDLEEDFLGPSDEEY